MNDQIDSDYEQWIADREDEERAAGERSAECPYCEGTGELRIVRQRCPWCGGSGRKAVR